MVVAAAERDNCLWVKDLRDEGGAELRRSRALEDLRNVLRRGLTRSLASRGQAVDSVEDFVQEAMLKIIDRLDDFKGESLFTTWATAIAIRVAFTEMRRARWKDRSLDEMLGGGEREAMGKLFAVPSDVEYELHRRQVSAALETAMLELSERQRTVLLAELSGVPKSVLADRLQTKTNALYKASHDARRNLRRGLLATGLSEAEIRAALSP